MDFPDDENGDVLRRMLASGDDLSRPRNVDFVVVFPDQSSAETFAGNFHRLGYATSVGLAEVVKEFPWDVRVVKHMAPSHDEITDFENLLQGAASALGGRNDGWGSISQPSSTLLN